MAGRSGGGLREAPEYAGLNVDGMVTKWRQRAMAKLQSRNKELHRKLRRKTEAWTALRREFSEVRGEAGALAEEKAGLLAQLRAAKGKWRESKG